MKKKNYRSGYRLRTFQLDRGSVKQWGRLLTTGVFLWIGLLLGVSKSEAATLCVNPGTGYLGRDTEALGENF